MSQIFLFTGDNEYELRNERHRWVRGFAAKHGEENLVTIDAKDLTISLFMDEICTAPFIAEKRLVVVDGLPKLDKDHYASIENGIHPQVLLVFVETKPDKRLGFTKAVLANATVKTFTNLRGSTLRRWLQELAQAEGASLGNTEASFLMEVVGENQTLLANEVCKLATFAAGKPITRQDIERLTMLSVEQAGWKLMDLLAARKKNEALAFVAKLQQRGESPYALWNMFLWMVTQLALVGAAVADGMTSPGVIAKQCGVNPMTARNLLGLAKQMPPEKLLQIVRFVIDADVALKTGGHKATAEAPTELEALIDSSVAAVAA